MDSRGLGSPAKKKKHGSGAPQEKAWKREQGNALQLAPINSAYSLIIKRVKCSFIAAMSFLASNHALFCDMATLWVVKEHQNLS
jgi:hypothetical protein